MDNKNVSSKKIRRNWHLRHDPSFKRKVALEYLEGGKSCRQVAEKYGTVDHTQVAAWARALKQELKAEGKVVVPETFKLLNVKQPDSPEYLALQKELEQAKLKIAGLETMISIADEQLGVSIRKKYGTKQS
ncbi:hypothetical protein CAP35_01390 [Chitinophagaceae bacterium IBVUCB1]|nr:hypothetical protein CAP35_01390 [Chitinophagaceae bacterium IBVUCB1]